MFVTGGISQGVDRSIAIIRIQLARIHHVSQKRPALAIDLIAANT
jgi:hypothetical protein